MLQCVETYVFSDFWRIHAFLPHCQFFASRHENAPEHFNSKCPLYSKRRHLIIRKVFNMEELVTKRVKMIYTYMNHLSNN